MKNWLSQKLKDENQKKMFSIPSGYSCDRCQKPSRCCDFSPFIPNFLVGQILKSHPKWSVPKERSFSLGLLPDRHRSMCEFFKDQRCEIWTSRPSECAAYFCDSFQENRDSAFSSQKLFEMEFSLAQLSFVDLGGSRRDLNSAVEFWQQWVADEDGRGTLLLPPWPAIGMTPSDFYLRSAEWLQDFDIDAFIK